ncbi:MAG TPA: hypothetical protein VLC48_03285 [Gemmatimonadota bacterium]|nr:hypothetical protein [Gemmatimonadota bacterium]
MIIINVTIIDPSGSGDHDEDNDDAGQVGNGARRQRRDAPRFVVLRFV